ncbi:adenylate/guanylate cyclase domain-containing protein [Rhodoblastus sp.]|jgi:adenylate cyclase|uniref:CHASE2 domain-containing protein n=1 Tax=Rhodoblastus sp. TaxID=1962975 RepID=UPI0025FB340E|nr:adenylate/guanylate cyclase domain-containing protein [Rhodoblastus sp.]
MRRPTSYDANALPALAGALAVALFVALLVLDPARLATLARERAFDLLYAAFPREDATAKVVVIDIDRATLSRFGGWPLPRAKLALIVDKLAFARAKAVAIDIYFDGPDRDSPRALATKLSGLPGGEAVRPLADAMPDTDQFFAGSLRKAPSVLGALAAPGGPPPAFNPIGGGQPDPGLATMVDGFSGPYPPLADAALGLGVQSLFGEDGGLVRRVPLLFVSQGQIAPSLALETARIAEGAAMIDLDSPRRVVLGGRSATLDPGGAMRIHWSAHSHWRNRTLSASDLLDDRIVDARLADATALIGSSAPQAGALRSTSSHVLTSSVQIEAEAVEQLLDGTAPHEPHAALALTVAASALLGLASVGLMLFRGPAFGFAALAGLILAWFATVATVFLNAHLLLNPAAPTAAAFIGGNVAASVAFARTRRLKALISQRFEQYLAPHVVRAIVANPERLKREGEMRVVTALFTDIEDFTRLTTQLEPKALIALLDPYFDGVCRIIIDNGGMIDLIVGDAVHAFFNMPLDMEDHADRAVACAMAIIDFTQTFRSASMPAAAGFGRTRIGVETGRAIVGDVGGERRLNYTAHGGVSNAAARLEAANKEFGSSICIGPGAAGAIRRTRLVAIGKTQLRGFSASVEVYTPEALDTREGLDKREGLSVTPPTPEPRQSSPAPKACPESAPPRAP